MVNLLGGTYTEILEVYEARSPVNHSECIQQPLLVLQGSIDRVVPPNQAELIVDAIKKRGGVVEYKLYEGEGHGFRQGANIRDAFETELAFYLQFVKESASDEVEKPESACLCL